MRRKRNLYYAYCLLDNRFAVEVNFAAGAEGDDAVFEREDGMVFAESDISAGKDFRPALADNNIARASGLPGRELGAEVFRIGIS